MPYTSSSYNRRSSIYVTLTPFYQRMKKIEDTITNVEFRNGIEEIARAGVEVAQRKVMSTGTRYSSIRQSLGLGGRGRYVTGKMYNSIGYLIERGAKQLRMRVGFVKGRVENYFKYQETGFLNVWKFKSYGRGTYGPNANPGFAFERTAGKWTEGMFALRDARERMLNKRVDFFSKLSARIRRL